MRNNLRRVLLAGLCLSALTSKAFAQTAPPPPRPAPPPKAVEGVTVKAAPQEAVRASIDRRSYNVSSDLRAAGGSIADAMRNIPGAEVDVNGNLTLRGGRVAIMIDGQPSVLFTGPGASTALQAMPADRIDRVEVITNPTAAFSPEGPTGIINLVTKKTAPAGGSGAVRANLGDSGRANAAGNLSYVKGKLTLSADGGWRRDPQSYEALTAGAVTDPATGVTAPRSQRDDTSGAIKSSTAHAGFDYQIDRRTRLSGEVRYNTFNFDRAQLLSYRAGSPVSVVSRDGQIGNGQDTALGQLTLRRQFAGQDHNLTAFYSHSSIRFHLDNGGTETTLLPLPLAPSYEAHTARNDNQIDQFKVDYVRPMPGKAQLKTGFDLRAQDILADDRELRGPSQAAATVQPSMSDLFRYRQTLSAAYATYEQPLGRQWTLLAGLRIEDERLDLNQITQRLVVKRDDVELFPTLHAAYRTSPTTQWTLSYSSRIQRPTPLDLNPYRTLSDPYTIRAGNPYLKPEITQSFEGGWQYRKGPTSYLATLFYRQSQRGVTDLITPLTAGVLQVSRANLAQARNAGLELVAAGPLPGPWAKTVTYNASTDVYWNEITAPVLGVTRTQRQLTASGRASVSWNVTKNDLVQVNGVLNAGRLIPQGVIDPMFILFAGYRHKFTDRFALVATVLDPFDTIRAHYTVNGSGVTQDINVNPHVRGGFIGFTWTLGGAGRPQRDPGFDFSGAAASTGAGGL